MRSNRKHCAAHPHNQHAASHVGQLKVMLPRAATLQLARHTAPRQLAFTLRSAPSFAASFSMTAVPQSAPEIRSCEPALQPPPMYRTSPPPHHASTNPAKPLFRSPWPSAGQGSLTPFEFFKIRLFEWEGVPLPAPKDRPQPSPCAWVPNDSDADTNGKIVFTWIGHAGCHFRIPMPDSDQFVTVLTDPVLSNRCSPSQWVGPARLQEPPTSVASMAESTVDGVWPDVLVLSHNHYDHLDVNTIKALIARPNGRPVPHVFCTLGVASLLHSLGLPKDGVTELDWWQQRQIVWNGGSRGLKLTCTPAQHFSGRSLTDRNRSVWAGWVMEAVAGATTGKKVYFAGDSAFRSITRAHVASGQPDDVLPYCPAFEEIGQLLGPMDLSAIPIGAYKPRIAMSAVHMDPVEAVQVHNHVRSKRSIGIHWGSFNLAAEPVHEPPAMLKEEVAKQGLASDAFNVMEIGETQVF